MFRFLSMTILLVLGLSLAGCSGDDGGTGPAGIDGSANVVYSDWFTPGTYTLTTDVVQMNVLTHDEPAAEVTQEILDTGVVLVFGKLNGYNTLIWPTDQVGQLPISVQYSLSELDVWTPLLSVGNIRIQFINSNNLYNSISTTHEFRYVIIPGGVAARPSSLDGLDPRDLSYDEVCEIFGVPETGSRFQR